MFENGIRNLMLAVKSNLLIGKELVVDINVLTKDVKNTINYIDNGIKDSISLIAGIKLFSNSTFSISTMDTINCYTNCNCNCNCHGNFQRKEVGDNFLIIIGYNIIYIYKRIRMKSIAKVSILSCLVLNSLVAQEVNLDFFNKLGVVIEGGIKVVKYQELDNIYYLKGQPNNAGQGNGTFEFFLTKNFKQIIVGGKLIDATTKKEIKFLPSNDRLKALNGAEVMTYGTGEKVLYLFTDPECPYCKDFEKRLPSLKEKYTFKIYMFPLSFHKNAKKMSRYIMAGESNDIKFDRMLEIANGLITYKNYQGSVEETKRLNLEIEKQIKLGLGVEINGTPILMKPDGTKVNLGNI